MQQRHKFHYSFDNFTEYVKFCDQAPRLDGSGTSSRDGSYQFTNTHSWSEAMALAEKGWPDGYARIQKLMANVLEKVTDLIIRPTITHEVSGDMIDMGAFSEGIPECFLQWQEQTEVISGSNKVIRLVSNSACSGGVATEVIEMRGAIIMALAEALTMAGRQVEVHLVSCNTTEDYLSDSDDDTTYSMDVIVKEAHATLQVDQLSFVLGHPSTNRRFKFAFAERMAAGPLVANGYGAPKDIRPEQQGDIYIGPCKGWEPHFLTVENAQAWVIGQLKAQGVQLEERNA